VDRDVDPVRHGDAARARRVIGDRPEARGVDLAHVRESRSEAIVIRADERVAAEHVDVVVDDHQRALRERGVDAAGRVRQDEAADAEPRHHARGEHDRREVVPLVIVDAPGQRRNPFAGDGANHQAARMADDGRRRPVRQIRVGRGNRVEQRLRKIAEAGAEDDRRFRKRLAAAADVGGRLVDALPQ